MDFIISIFLDFIVNNPIIILLCIGYILVSFLKGSKSNDDGGTTENDMTWEEMERHYGLTMHSKADHTDPTAPTEFTEFTESTEAASNGMYRAVSMTDASPAKPETRTSAMEPVLDDAVKEQDLASQSIDQDTLQVRKRPLLQQSVTEGMKWSIILAKPKALKRTYR